MLKSIKIEDFVNGEWVNDSNGLLDSVDSSGLWKLKLGDDCILESIEKLDSIEGRDIVDIYMCVYIYIYIYIYIYYPSKEP